MNDLDFDQLLDVSRLRTLLAEATGAGITIGVLDTGVDVTHPDLQGAVIRSVDVVAQGMAITPRDLPADQMTAVQLDPVGHGTACAGIIHKLAPAAKLVSVRVIGAGSAGTGDQLVHGLRWAMEQCTPKLHVLNMSLGTVSKRVAVPLGELVDQAYFQGVVLVAAANNMGIPSYPARFAALIGVDSQSFRNPLEFRYQPHGPVELVARGIYVEAPKSGGGHQLWTGTSFACPHVTAVVARLLSLNPRLTPFQVKTLLNVLRSNRDGER